MKIIRLFKINTSFLADRIASQGFWLSPEQDLAAISLQSNSLFCKNVLNIY